MRRRRCACRHCSRPPAAHRPLRPQRAAVAPRASRPAPPARDRTRVRARGWRRPGSPPVRRCSRREERGAPPCRRQAQQGERVLDGGVLRARRRLVRPHGGACQREPPRAGRGRQPNDEPRRRRPAQAAGDAVHRERVMEAWRRQALVQDREVGGVERRVAEPRERGREHERRHALRRGAGERSEREAAERGEQHRARADPVDDEAGERLAGSRDHEEHRHRPADLGVAHADVAHERREQRRRQQVESGHLRRRRCAARCLTIESCRGCAARREPTKARR